MKLEPSYYFQRCKGTAKVCHSRESGQPRKMLSYQPFLPTSFTAALGAHSNRKSAKCSGFWTPYLLSLSNSGSLSVISSAFRPIPLSEDIICECPRVPLFFYSTAFSLFCPSPSWPWPLSLSPLSISAQITRAVYQSLSQQASLGEGRRGPEGRRHGS